MSQLTLAQLDEDISATVPPLSRLLEDLDAEFIDSLVNVADSLIDQVFPTGDLSTTSTSSSVTTTAEPSISLSIVTITTSEDESTTSPVQSETAAASCCDEDDDSGDDDDDNLGIILGSVFGALALIALALLIFFCYRRRKSKKRRQKDVATIEKNPSDTEAFLDGPPPVARATTTTTDAPNEYSGAAVPPSPPNLNWIGTVSHMGQTGQPSPAHERRQSTQPLIVPPRSMTATGEQLKVEPGRRPVVHPGIGELPAGTESQPLRESTPSASGAASELSSDKAQDGRNSSAGLPINTNTNTVSSITNTDATNDGSIPSTLNNPSSQPPWVGNGGTVAAAVSQHGSAKGLGSGPGPYDSDIAFRDQLSRSPPPIAKVPAQFNPYAYDENIYEHPTIASNHDTRLRSSSGPRAPSNQLAYPVSSRGHESYNSSNSGSGVEMPNIHGNGRQWAMHNYDGGTNVPYTDSSDSPSTTLYSDNYESRGQPQSRAHPHPPSVITSSLPQHKISTDGLGEVSPLVSPPARNPLRPHSGQYIKGGDGGGGATDFNFEFDNGSAHRYGFAGTR